LGIVSLLIASSKKPVPLGGFIVLSNSPGRRLHARIQNKVHL
jgi:hypothetical protein